MAELPLLIYDEVTQYKAHYQRHYCRGVIETFDGIRVYFRAQVFDHAFYKNSKNCPGPKDMFCDQRAQRMDWIKATLESAEASLYQGWNKAIREHEEDRRVSVLLGDFVVVIELSLKNNGKLKANFKTCYVADSSIDMIKESPLWDKELCIEKLKKKKGR